jgi:hypothetical protein
MCPIWGVVTTADAKHAHANRDCGAFAPLTRLNSVVMDVTPRPRIGLNVTAANDRSVWYSPPTGWVTVLAGLLARGS